MRMFLLLVVIVALLYVLFSVAAEMIVRFSDLFSALGF